MTTKEILPDLPSIKHIEDLLQQEGPFLSLSQAARKVRIPLQTLSSAVHSGRVRALTMPDNRKYVHLQEVVDYFANREEEDDSLVWQRKLLVAGLISEIKPRASRRPLPDDYEPVPIKGEPISETVIRERR
jgi:hypothetical protein